MLSAYTFLGNWEEGILYFAFSFLVGWGFEGELFGGFFNVASNDTDNIDISVGKLKLYLDFLNPRGESYLSILSGTVSEVNI